MPDLIVCEFQKLKRRKFVLFAFLSACIFPIPLVFLAVRQSQEFFMIFRMIFIFSEMLFLPCIIGILGSILFLGERDSDTLKNILVIPISKTKILLSKCFVLLCMSVIYSVAGLCAAIIVGIFTGRLSDLLGYIIFSILCGIFMFCVAIPVVFVIIALNKNFTISIIVAFLYACVCFAVAYLTMAEGGYVLLEGWIRLLPVIFVFRWYLGFFPLEERLSLYLPYTLSSYQTFAYMAVLLLIFLFAAIFVYNREKD